jgi:hypothetical protein
MVERERDTLAPDGPARRPCPLTTWAAALTWAERDATEVLLIWWEKNPFEVLISYQSLSLVLPVQNYLRSLNYQIRLFFIPRLFWRVIFT